MYYRQCKFRSKGHETVAWIPEVHAKKNLRVRFEGGDRWWTVVTVGTTRRSEKAVKAFERAHLKQRQLSDV